MSAKRKLKRNTRSKATPVESAADKASLRRQASNERFKKPGAEKLWEVLLGWDEPKLRRIWLVQAIQDQASQNGDASARAMLENLPARLANQGATLNPDRIVQAVAIWSDDSDDYRPEAPAPKWHFLANWIEQLGWGETSAEALQFDWEIWTNLGLAGKPRAYLMQLLQQTEQAGSELYQLTHSENIGAVANVSRALWFALAYGDEETFEKIKSWSRTFSPRLKGS